MFVWAMLWNQRRIDALASIDIRIGASVLYRGVRNFILIYCHTRPVFQCTYIYDILYAVKIKFRVHGAGKPLSLVTPSCRFSWKSSRQAHCMRYCRTTLIFCFHFGCAPPTTRHPNTIYYSYTLFTSITLLARLSGEAHKWW